MGFFDKIKSFRKASKKELSQATANSYGGVSFGGNYLTSRSKPMLLSAVYRCVDLISDSLAILPFIVYEKDARGFKTEAKLHPCYLVLNLEPNEDMTRYVFMKTMATSALLTGNAYAYIERNSLLEVEQLIYIPTNQVDIEFIPDENGILRKRYRVNGFSRLVEPRDMIHVLNFTYDGIKGVSTLTHAAQTLKIAASSEAHAESAIGSGGVPNGLLKIEGPRLTEEQKDDIYDKWYKRRAGGLAILEHNMSYQSISISPKDLQLLESRAFSVIEIARFFSVSPVKLFDLSKSSYATVEATQLQYLADTVAPVIIKFEQEFQRKLFLRSEQRRYSVEFDTSELLRTDKAAQATFWRELSNIGAATPNEIRRPMNLPPLPDGDNAFIQINMQTLSAAAKQSENNQLLKDNGTESETTGKTKPRKSRKTN